MVFRGVQPHDRRGANDQQAAEVAVALLADAALAILAAAAVRLRRPAEPCGEPPAGTEQ